jgi:hypothetical protein
MNFSAPFETQCLTSWIRFNCRRAQRMWKYFPTSFSASPDISAFIAEISTPGILKSGGQYKPQLFRLHYPS